MLTPMLLTTIKRDETGEKGNTETHSGKLKSHVKLRWEKCKRFGSSTEVLNQRSVKRISERFCPMLAGGFEKHISKHFPLHFHWVIPNKESISHPFPRKITTFISLLNLFSCARFFNYRGIFIYSSSVLKIFGGERSDKGFRTLHSLF